MFHRSLVVLATLGLCVGVDIKFPKLQDRPPLQFSPKLPARPVWVQPKVPVGPQVRFPDDPTQTVKIFENYTSTNVEKSQVCHLFRPYRFTLTNRIVKLLHYLLITLLDANERVPLFIWGLHYFLKSFSKQLLK
jgi:hypothetical protein